MKAGTPGFVGQSLALARRMRGLTATALADLIGVSRQAVSQYEGGHQTPRPDVMDRISSVLQVPCVFFLADRSRADSSPIFFRSLSSATVRGRDRVEANHQLVRHFAAWASQFVQLPPPDIPGLSSTDPARLSDDEIEDAALRVRQHWGLGDGPISNLVWLLENKGVVVSRFEFDEVALDGFSQWSDDDERPYVVLNADKSSAARSRFDAAHELAHLVLHRGFEPRPGPQFKRLEEQAHRFAGAFLFPESAFSREALTLSLPSFQTLKRRWVVSIGVMIKRAAHLGYVSEMEEQRLWRYYSSRGYRRREPLDDVLPVEEPRLLSRAFEMIVENGVLTRQQILDDLPILQHDIERLAGLPKGYLNPQPAQVLRLKSSAPGGGPRDSGGHVVPFRGRDR